MSAEEENKKLALTVIEALNTRDLDPWSQNLSDDYVAEYPGVPLLNKTQSVGYNKRFVIAFPDTHFDVNSVVAQGDQVFIHWTVSGTQAEPLHDVAFAVAWPVLTRNPECRPVSDFASHIR